MSDEMMEVAERIGATVDAATMDSVSAVLEAQTAEIERLRERLVIARAALLVAGEQGLEFGAPARFHDRILDALRRSDPDAAAGR
jgi:hypothetical protein